MKTRLSLSGLVLLLLSSFAAGPVSAAPTDDEGCTTTVVRAWFSDRSQIEAFAAHDEPWEIHHDKGWMLVGVDPDGMQRLIDLGFGIEVDEQRTAQICTPRASLKNQTEGIPGYPCYRTVEETFQSAQDLVAGHPDLASWIDVGDSWEKTTPGGNPGYDLMVLRLSNANVVGTPPPGSSGKPRLFVTSAIHAREYTTAELMIRFAEYLVTNHGIDPDATWLLDEHEVHLLLMTNPDGRKHAETGLSWRKNTNENYCSPASTSRGADLNRNFEFQWNCCGGSSGDECDILYRGPSPSSEPETQSVRDYLRSIFPDQRDDDLTAAAPTDATGVYIDVHSYSELVMWPWGFTSNTSGNASSLQTMGRRLAYFNGYEPDQAIGLYPVDGSTIDFAYGDLGVAAYLFELGNWFFEDCAVFESTIFPDNLQSMIWAAKVVRTPYLTPAGPEITGATAAATVASPGDLVAIQATADDTRYNNSNGVEPTQPVVAAELYVDVPPWQSGATATALTASDGTFDSPVEAVDGLLDTAGLAEGRHTLFLRALDADGNWGPVSGLLIWVLDPTTAAHISGTAISSDTGTPLAATISSGPFISLTNPASGAYDLVLPDGVFEVTATADGYVTETVGGVAATSGGVTTLDWVLIPYEVVFEDDVEIGANGWTTDGRWVITTEASASPTHSWTESPGVLYGHDWNASLFSPAMDLTAVEGVVLEFSHIYELEDGYDFGHVELSTDAGASWTTAASYNGSHTADWERVVLPLPGLDNSPDARIRFRIETDYSWAEDGWHIDDIVIRGFTRPPATNIFSDGFEGGDTSAWSSVVPTSAAAPAVAPDSVWTAGPARKP
jgi:hypothetical protein